MPLTPRGYSAGDSPAEALKKAPIQTLKEHWTTGNPWAWTVAKCVAKWGSRPESPCLAADHRDLCQTRWQDETNSAGARYKVNRPSRPLPGRDGSGLDPEFGASGILRGKARKGVNTGGESQTKDSGSRHAVLRFPKSRQLPLRSLPARKRRRA